MEKIKINDKEYKVKVATTDEEKIQGLQGVETLPDDEGMLFEFDPPEDISFWMKDTPLKLKIIFLDEDLNIISIHTGLPNDETLISEDNVSYVLEINDSEEVNKDDDIEFSSDEQVNGEMLVLDEEGNAQMKLKGGERIFSRKNTKTLIKFASRAYTTKQDKDYKAVGKRVLKFLNIQNSNDPEYVTK